MLAALTETLHMWNMSHASQTEHLPTDPRVAGKAARAFPAVAPRLRPLERDRPEIGHALSAADAVERARAAGIPLAGPRASGASGAPCLPFDGIGIGACARASPRRCGVGAGRSVRSVGMSATLPRWRRIALRLVRHASWVLPGARSDWAEAMRHEIAYIEDGA